MRRTERTRAEFMGLVSHELRNPLGAVSNALQVMKLASPGTAAFDRARESAERQVEHQSRLVNDLLDVARINHGRLHLHPERIDLVRLVRETVEDYRSRLEGAGLTLSAALPAISVRVASVRTYMAVRVTVE